MELKNGINKHAEPALKKTAELYNAAVKHTLTATDINV